MKASAAALRAAIPEQERPRWLEDLSDAIDQYVRYPIEGGPRERLQRSVTAHYSAVRGHKWKFEEDESKGIDFEAIYRAALNDSNLSSVFDEIVDILRQLIPQIDTISAVQTLEELIATFRANRDGSFFSVRGAWELMVRVWSTEFWEPFRTAPATANAFERLSAAVERGAESFSSLQEGCRQRVAAAFAVHVRYVEGHKPAFKDIPRVEHQVAEARPE